MIFLDSVYKSFEDTVAVKGLTLEVRKGELFVLLGPNGAGKTTTLKLVGGLLRPNSGRILVDGIDINKDWDFVKGRFGYIPDRYFLYEKLTIYEYMQFVGKMYGVEMLYEQIKDKLSLFGLWERRDMLIEFCSHGMKQRLVFASTFLHSPEIIIIDEPMVGLDPAGVKLVKEILRDRVQTGCTIFMSTHTIPIAEDLASRIGVIRNGELIAIGTVDELRGIVDKSVELEELYIQLTEYT